MSSGVGQAHIPSLSDNKNQLAIMEILNVGSILNGCFSFFLGKESQSLSTPH